MCYSVIAEMETWTKSLLAGRTPSNQAYRKIMAPWNSLTDCLCFFAEKKKEHSIGVLLQIQIQRHQTTAWEQYRTNECAVDPLKYHEHQTTRTASDPVTPTAIDSSPWKWGWECFNVIDFEKTRGNFVSFPIYFHSFSKCQELIGDWY